MKNMKRIGWVGQGAFMLGNTIYHARKESERVWGKAIPVYIDPKDLRGKK